MEYDQITSRQNPRIKDIAKLKDKKYRQKSNLFLIEGFREIERARDAGIRLVELYFYKGFFRDGKYPLLIESVVKLGADTVEVSKGVFDKISLREGPDGLLAVGEIKNRPLSELQLSSNPLLVIAEGIEKPGNLGGLVRSIEGTGADGLILCDCLIDIYNPNVIRNSQGGVFSLPIFTASNDEAYRFLKEQNIKLIATTPHTEKLYWDIDMSGRTGLLLGSESAGLSKFWLEKVTEHIKIPMHGSGDSLNVSIAGSLCLYESLRQRRPS